jgi:hypothetical protein
MASLTRKSDCKFWIGCFTDANGKQRQRSTRMTDRKAASCLAETWESLYQRRLTSNQARRVIAEVVREITGENVAGEPVAAYLKRWVGRKTVETSASTAYAYKRTAEGFVAHLGERAERLFLDEITTAHISAWRDARAKGRAPTTANISLKILRIAFQDALRDGLIMQNPAALVPTIKRREGDGSSAARRPFTLKELRRVLAVANDEWRGLVLAGIYTASALATWRG